MVGTLWGASACGPPADPGSAKGAPATATSAAPSTPSVSRPADGTAGVPPTTGGSDEAAVDAHAFLAPLEIDDSSPPLGYRREDWPLWKDIDNDGCDARQQALIAASDPPANVGAKCAVRSGHWVSAYDGFETTAPGDLDIDHVVPLANAFRSGADTWSTDERTQYANDQADLWVVSASSNRSKGDQGPDEWRPPRHDSWCRYAKRWTTIKIRWHLTATTAERDALGQMLDTCGAGATPEPSASETGVTPIPSDPVASPVPTTGGSVYYATCAAAKAAGVTNIHRGDPGYRPELDRDNDGVACEA